MQPVLDTLKGWENILFALSVYGYLTAAQLTRLRYAPSSLSFVRKQLQFLVARDLALKLPGRVKTLPTVYTPTSKGYTYLAQLGVQDTKRVRPVDEREKAKNLLFLQHTLAVNDVLIGATLLSHTHANIELTRLYTERELRRKIYVKIPEKICIEPDASCEFEITVTADGKQHIGVDFFYIEVYRYLPKEGRFKQKIRGYVVYVETGQHAALFGTPALSIGVVAQTEQMATLLKSWTEEVLQQMERPEEGERFFFRYIENTALATPDEMFLAPVWQQAFGTAKTPLIILEGDAERHR
jgi:hypothetical protein